jgi:hypothetical protein
MTGRHGLWLADVNVTGLTVALWSQVVKRTEHEWEEKEPNGNGIVSVAATVVLWFHPSAPDVVGPVWV